jgi:hypothetical protein
VQANIAASLPPTQPPPSYASATMPIVAQQTNERLGGNTTRVDLSQLERQQAELEQREKRLAERERALRNPQITRKFDFFVVCIL